MNKVPGISVTNSLYLDPDPMTWLSDLEQQLIALNLLFMKIKKLPRSRMKAVIDRVISVPLEANDITKTVKQLPRNPNEAYIIAVRLKRKLELKGAHGRIYMSSQCHEGIRNFDF